jgi:DNA-binding transcriptional MerR regulator
MTARRRRHSADSPAAAGAEAASALGLTADGPGGFAPDPARAHEPRHFIGYVAARTGLTPRTLRFYEQQGLLRPAARRLGGFRVYSDLDIQRALLIRQLQQLLGLSLAEVATALAADPQPAPPSARAGTDQDLAAQRARATAALATLEQDLAAADRQLARLAALRAELAARADGAREVLAQLDAAIAERERTITRGRESPLPAALPAAEPPRPPDRDA